VPEYLLIITLSPTDTVIGFFSVPGPTATTSDISGFSCAEAARIRPYCVVSSASTDLRRTLSASGLIVILCHL
jgi:hypothetical protein